MSKFRVIEAPSSVFIGGLIKVTDIEADNRARANEIYLSQKGYRANLLLLDQTQTDKLIGRLSKFEPEDVPVLQPVKKDGNKAIDKQALESRLKELKDNLAEIEESEVPSDIMAEAVEQMQTEVQEIEQKLKGL